MPSTKPKPRTQLEISLAANARRVDKALATSARKATKALVSNASKADKELLRRVSKIDKALVHRAAAIEEMVVQSGLDLADRTAAIEAVLGKIGAELEARVARPVPEVLSIAEACDLLTVSRVTIWRMAKTKKINILKIAGCARIRLDEVRRLLTPATQETVA